MKKPAPDRVLPASTKPVVRYRVKISAKLIEEIAAFKTAHGFATSDDALNFVLTRGFKAMGIDV